MIICTRCGQQNQDGAVHCERCGTMLSAPAPRNTTYGPAVVAEPGKGLAIASMVCGIVSFFCFGVILGILAIIFGAVAKSKGYRGGMATAGIVLGAIGLAFYVIMLIIFGSLSCATSSLYY